MKNEITTKEIALILVSLQKIQNETYLANKDIRHPVWKSISEINEILAKCLKD